MANKRITDVDIIESLDSNESFFVNKNNALKQIKKEKIIFGVNNGGTGATTASAARANLGATAISSLTLELTVDKWTSNQQIVSASGVTKDNTVIVAPEASIDNYEAYAECGVRCVSQANGTLTFSCKSVPETNIDVNVAIFS